MPARNAAETYIHGVLKGKIVRDRRVVLPRAGKLMEEFANHLAADVKQLVEDEDTGAQAFRYVRTGTNHYSLAFTYDCIAWSRDSWSPGRAVVDVSPLPEGNLLTREF